MVDVGAKEETRRAAVAEGRIEMRPETLRLILEGGHGKGDVLGVARIAAIQAAKRTADLIPLCHPLPLTRIEVDLETAEEGRRGGGALPGAGRDGGPYRGGDGGADRGADRPPHRLRHVQAADRSMTINSVRLLEKSGGRSGRWQAGAAKEDPAR